MPNDPFDATILFPASVDTFPNLADYESVAALTLPAYHTKLWASNYNKIANFINKVEPMLIRNSPTLSNTFSITQPYQVASITLLDVLKQLDPYLYNNSKAPLNYLPFEVILSTNDLTWKFWSGRVTGEPFYSYKTATNFAPLFGSLSVFNGNLLASAALDVNYESLTTKVAGYQNNFTVNSYITVNGSDSIIIRGAITDAYIYSGAKPVGAPNGLLLTGTTLPSYTSTNWMALGSQRKLTISLIGIQ